MSYILEALKRSQHQREIGQVPTPVTGQAETLAGTTRTTIRLPLWALVATSLVIVTTVSALLWVMVPSGTVSDHEARMSPSASTGGEAPRSASTPIGTSVAPLPEERLARARLEEAATGPAPSFHQPAPFRDRDLQTWRVEEEHWSGPDADAGYEDESIADTLEAGLEELPEDVSPAPAPPSIKEQVRDLERRLLEAQARLEKQEPAAASMPAPDAGSAVVDRREQGAASPADVPADEDQLPRALYNRLPERKINVLAYSPDPARRFAIVNSRKLREGERTEQGLVVERILRDGVVFAFEEHRFFTSAYR